MTSGHLQRYIDDVVMDIDPRYYPPPLVHVPDIVIPSPVLPQYSFSVENTAIKEYERLNKKLSDVSEQSTLQISNTPLQEVSEVNPSIKRTVFTDTASSSNSLESTNLPFNISSLSNENSNRNNSTSSTFSRPLCLNGILMPSRATVVPKVKSENIGKESNMTFEEFEPKPNLFDLLEMRTIDDKSLLEQVLSASLITNSMSAAVPGCHSENTPRNNNSSSVLPTAERKGTSKSANDVPLLPRSYEKP